MYSVLLAAAAAIAASGVAPQPINPGLITVSDIAADKRELGNENKFFVFHRENTSFAEAEADLRFCMRYIHQPIFPVPPSYVPWVEKANPEGKPPINGGIIGGMVVSGVQRSLRQSNMMRCMLPRGYARYRVSEGLWREINYRDLESSTIVQAGIASGPVPSTPRSHP